LLLDKSKQNTSKAMNSNKTAKQVLAENSEYKTLINAVIRQLGGKESLSDIRNHGISGGFTGFTYYSDTVAFANRHRSSINRLLEQMADELGEDVVSMVSNFGVFRNSGMDAEDKKDLYRFLGGGKCKETTIPNLMAWFAAEEVARMFENY
jgi:hypothetical protein